MPGAGKSTLGRYLATHYGCPFLDLDDAIVARAGRGIPAIFAAEGEAFFRRLEADTLRAVVAQPGPLVLATGGGTPCFHQNLEVLQPAGPTLWLDVPVPVLATRLRAAGLASRPLLAAAQTTPIAAAASPSAAADALENWLRETLAARQQFYALARLRLPDSPNLLRQAQVLLAATGFGPAATHQS